MKIADDDVRAGRFSQRFVFHERPDVIAQLEQVAAASGLSGAAAVRSAVRQWLREQVEYER
jgi:hypothetical protein